VVATSWADLTARVRQATVDAVLIDPACDGGVETEAVLRLMSDFPSAPFVVYTVMTPATFAAVHVLSKHGLHEVMLFGYDDTSERVATLLEDLPQRQLLPFVLETLTPAFARLPRVLRQRAYDVLRNPHDFPSVAAFLRGISFSRSSVYNMFHEAGLGSPGRLLVGARLMHAVAYLEDPGHSLRQTALKSGWTDPRILTRYLKIVLQLSRPKKPIDVGYEELARRLTEWMCAESEDDP
jgi:AraC-like DNA-binding protein